MAHHTIPSDKVTPPTAATVGLSTRAPDSRAVASKKKLDVVTAGPDDHGLICTNARVKVGSASGATLGVAGALALLVVLFLVLRAQVRLREQITRLLAQENVRLERQVRARTPCRGRRGRGMAGGD